MVCSFPYSRCRLVRPTVGDRVPGDPARAFHAAAAFRVRGCRRTAGRSTARDATRPSDSHVLARLSDVRASARGTSRSKASTIPLSNRNVRLGGSSAANAVPCRPSARSAASANMTAGDSAIADALALRAIRSRSHASRRRRDAASPGGTASPGIDPLGKPAAAGTAAPSGNHSSVSSHTSPRRQLMN